MVEDLVADDGDHLKGLSGGDRVDDHVAMDTDEVLRVEDAVLVLARRVDDLGHVVLALVLDGAVEGVLDRRVVVLDKGALDEADGQRRFACHQLAIVSLVFCLSILLYQVCCLLSVVYCLLSLELGSLTNGPTAHYGDLALFGSDHGDGGISSRQLHSEDGQQGG